MSTHEEDRLVDYLYGELAEGDAQAFESALADDPELDEAVGDYAAILHAAREEAAELEPSAHLDALILAHARQAAEAAAVPWWRGLLSSPFLGLAVAGTCAALIAVVLLPQRLENEASEPLAGAPAPVTATARPTATPAPEADEGFVPTKLEAVGGEAEAPAEAPAQPTADSSGGAPAGSTADPDGLGGLGGLGLRGAGRGGGGGGVSTGLGGLGTIGHGSGGGSGYGAGPTVARGDGAARPASRRPARRARDSSAAEAERQAAQAAAAHARRAEAEASLAKEAAEEARAAEAKRRPSAAPAAPPPPAAEPTPAPAPGRSLAVADDLAPSDDKAAKGSEDEALSPEARERQARAVAEAARGEALVAMQARDPDKARRIYVKAREQTRGTLSYYRITLWLARLEFDAGRYEEAVAYGREASRTGERPVADEARRLVAASSRRPDALLDSAESDDAR